MVSYLSLGVINHPEKLNGVAVVSYASRIVKIVIVNIDKYVCIFRVIYYIRGRVRIIVHLTVAVGIALLNKFECLSVGVSLVFYTVNDSGAFYGLNNNIRCGGGNAKCYRKAKCQCDNKYTKQLLHFKFLQINYCAIIITFF